MIRVLHVDENRDHLEIAKLHIQRLADDIEIDWALSADEAIDRLEGDKYDCVLCDFQMPGTNGLQLLRILRQKGENKPFIFLTGQGNEEVAAEALRSGADDYFTKQLTFAHYERLLHSIRRLVHAHNEWMIREKAERALRESEERYRNLVERANDGIILIQDGIIKYANPRLGEMSGWELEEIRDQPFTRFIPPETVRDIMETSRKREDGVNTKSIHETTFICTGGELLPVEINSGVITSGGRHADLIFVRDISERKRMEEELRASEQKYKSLFYSSKDAIYFSARDGRIIEMNPAGAELLGYTEDELKNIKTPMTYADPSVREKHRPMIEEQGYIKDFPVDIRKKDGTIRTVLVTSTVHRDKNGNVIGYHGMLRDVTEQRRAEKIQSSVYKISEATITTQNLQELFRSIHGIVAELMPAENFYIALFDEGQGVLSFPYFVDEFDDTPKPRRLGKGLTEYVLRTEKPLLASPEAFEKLTAAGEVEPIGAPSIDWLGVPLKTRGKAMGVLAVQSYTEGVRFGDRERDILMFVSNQVAMAIERKQAEEALKRSEERYRAFLERSSEGIWCIEFEEPLQLSLPEEEQLNYFFRHGYFVDCNDPMARMYGFAGAEEVIGKRVGEILHHDNPVDVDYMRESVSSRFQLINAESHQVEKNGCKRYFLNNAIGIIENDTLLRAWATRREITRLKMAEEELKRSREQLEDRADELKALNRELEAFTYSVSHDLQSHLRHAAGYMDIFYELHAKDLSEKATRDIDRVKVKIKRMKERIGELLKLSRIIRTVPEKRPVDLCSLAEEIFAELQRADPDRIAVFTAAPGITVVSDEKMLRIVLENLIGNAWKFTTPKQNAAIEFGSIDNSGKAVYFVRDNGVGFDPSFKDQLFIPFQRLHGEKEFEGSGIGLATVRRAVQRLGGETWAEGEPGKGAAFFFTLG
jgi:PAS domain S-box-containing protein